MCTGAIHGISVSYKITIENKSKRRKDFVGTSFVCYLNPIKMMIINPHTHKINIKIVMKFYF